MTGGDVHALNDKPRWLGRPQHLGAPQTDAELQYRILPRTGQRNSRFRLPPSSEPRSLPSTRAALVCCFGLAHGISCATVSDQRQWRAEEKGGHCVSAYGLRHCCAIDTEEVADNVDGVRSNAPALPLVIIAPVGDRHAYLTRSNAEWWYQPGWHSPSPRLSVFCPERSA